MTTAERAAYTASLRRALRDDEVRRGTRRPQTMRETEIMLAGFADREARHDRRAERAWRRQPPPQDGREAISAVHLPDNATAEDVARWMADCLERDGHLDQRDAAHELAGRFGDQFTCRTANGHLGISQRALRAFRKAADGPSWDQRSLCWLRQPEGAKAGVDDRE
jgi:hypothetical protein